MDLCIYILRDTVFELWRLDLNLLTATQSYDRGHRWVYRPEVGQVVPKAGQGQQNSIRVCFHKLGVRFVGVLKLRARKLGSLSEAPAVWKLPPDLDCD